MLFSSIFENPARRKQKKRPPPRRRRAEGQRVLESRGRSRPTAPAQGRSAPRRKPRPRATARLSRSIRKSGAPQAKNAFRPGGAGAKGNGSSNHGEDHDQQLQRKAALRRVGDRVHELRPGSPDRFGNSARRKRKNSLRPGGAGAEGRGFSNHEKITPSSRPDLSPSCSSARPLCAANSVSAGTPCAASETAPASFGPALSIDSKIRRAASEKRPPPRRCRGRRAAGSQSLRA